MTKWILCSLQEKLLLSVSRAFPDFFVVLEMINTQSKGELYCEMYLLVHYVKFFGYTWSYVYIAPVIPVQYTMQVAVLLCLSRHSPNSALQFLDKLPHCHYRARSCTAVGVLTRDIYNGLNTTQRDWVPHAACTYLFLPSLWVKPTPLLGKRCDKTRGKGSGK